MDEQLKLTSIKQKVSVQIITGFLGTGKTSYILHLLENKPKNARWAVLTNEVGNACYPIDALQEKGVFIKEIYGGCLCCSAGLVFKTSLNRMLKEIKPEFILIEPAGYGHLNNIISLLAGSHYKDILTMKTTVCMVHSRQLADIKYSENKGYQDLIKRADSLLMINNQNGQLAKEIAIKYNKPCNLVKLSRN